MADFEAHLKSFERHQTTQLLNIHHNSKVVIVVVALA